MIANGIDNDKDLKILIARESKYPGKSLVVVGKTLYLGDTAKCSISSSTYDNSDNSLVFLSNNPRMFPLCSGFNFEATQDEALIKNFIKSDYAEYAELLNGPLKELYLENPATATFAGNDFMYVSNEVSWLPSNSPVSTLVNIPYVNKNLFSVGNNVFMCNGSIDFNREVFKNDKNTDLIFVSSDLRLIERIVDIKHILYEEELGKWDSLYRSTKETRREDHIKNILGRESNPLAVNAIRKEFDAFMTENNFPEGSIIELPNEYTVQYMYLDKNEAEFIATESFSFPTKELAEQKYEKLLLSAFNNEDRLFFSENGKCTKQFSYDYPPKEMYSIKYLSKDGTEKNLTLLASSKEEAIVLAKVLDKHSAINNEHDKKVFERTNLIKTYSEPKRLKLTAGEQYLKLAQKQLKVNCSTVEKIDDMNIAKKLLASGLARNTVLQALCNYSPNCINDYTTAANIVNKAMRDPQVKASLRTNRSR